MIALLAGCAEDPGDSAAPGRDIVAELAAPGPWGVGYRQETLLYADAIAGGERELRLALWYPTAEESGEEAAYLRGAIPAAGVLAGAAPAEGSFPAAVFSHGHQGYAENSAFLAEHLASHGWIVAAPDHTGNTTLDGAERDTAIYLQRPLDISAALGWLGDPPAGDPLAGRIAEERAALGHSFGGYTAHALAGAAYDGALIADCLAGADTSEYCAGMTDAYAERLAAGFADPRLRAFVSMAPGDYRLFGAAGLGQVAAPTLHMTGGLDPNEDNETIWAALAGGDHMRVHLPAGGHQTFTDFSGVLEDFDGLIDPEEGWRIIDVYALAWLRRHALGDPAVEPILSGEAEVSAEAGLSR